MDETKALLLDTWRFFSRHFISICSIMLPIIVPLNLFYAFAGGASTDGGQMFWFTLVLGILIYPLYQAALIFYIAGIISGKVRTRDECYQFSMRSWLPLTLLTVMSTGAVMAGLTLFILPALFVMARLAFSEFYCALHGVNPAASFSASWEATKEKQWVIIGGGIVISLVAVAPLWGLDKLVSLLGIENPVISFLLGTLETLLMAPFTIFGYRVFSLQHTRVNTRR
jgi:hypothetical protein